MRPTPNGAGDRGLAPERMGPKRLNLPTERFSNTASRDVIGRWALAPARAGNNRGERQRPTDARIMQRYALNRKTGVSNG